jgi:hypothetical protein
MTSTIEDLRLAAHPFRGLKQTIGTVLIALLITAIAWGIWAGIAHRKLQARIDAIAAAHQPFWLADFETPPIPREQNAAELWKAVFAAFPSNDTTPSNAAGETVGSPPYSAKWYQMEDQAVILNARVFQLAHQAAAARQIDWGIKAREKWDSFPYFAEIRKTSNVLTDAALHAHLHGDDALALQRLHDMLQLARAEGANGTRLDEIYDRIFTSFCCDRLMVMAPDLTIDAADRSAIVSMIHELLDTSGTDQLRVASMDGERMNVHNQLAEERRHRRVLAPLITLTEASVLETRVVDRLAASAPNDVAARIVYQSHLTRMMLRNDCPSSRDEFVGVYSYDFGALDWYVTDEWKAIASRRAAALALAIRLYRSDNAKWPDHLGDLIPQYIPSVPEDPLMGGPIGYVIRKNALPTGGDRPLLYFNLSTDPTTSAPPAYPVYFWDGHLTQWRDLTLWTPPPPPPQPMGPSGPGGFSPMGPPGMPGMPPMR